MVYDMANVIKKNMGCKKKQYQACLNNMLILSAGYVRILFHEGLDSVDDEDTAGRGIGAAALEVVDDGL